MVKDASNITKPRKTMQQAIGFNFYDVFVVGFCVIFALICFYPMWYVLVASVTPYEQFVKGGALLWPNGGVDFQCYRMIFENSSFVTSLWISASKTVLGTLLSVLVTSTMAYAVSKVYVPGMKLLNVLTVFTMFFAGGLIPSYLLFKDLGILNSMWVFILPGAVNVYNVIIARSFFETSIPEELHDAAQVDGLGYFRYFMKIVLPLSSAIIAVIALYYFVGHWNDFFTGLIYIRNQEKQPLQNVLQNILLANQMTTSGGGSDGRSMLERQQAADQIKYGIIIVSTLPLLVVYPFLQKYFNKGVMIGAVKG